MIKSIVVVDSQWGIGKNNDLLFKLPKDLQQYKQKTMGNVCVMGANTYLSLPKVALSGRTNVVLDDTDSQHENAVTVSTLADLLSLLRQYGGNDVFVIGGASVYKLLLPYCDEAFVTKVKAVGNATVFYPDLDEDEEWECVQVSETVVDNGYETCYCTYKRITSNRQA